MCSYSLQRHHAQASGPAAPQPPRCCRHNLGHKVNNPSLYSDNVCSLKGNVCASFKGSVCPIGGQCPLHMLNRCLWGLQCLPIAAWPQGECYILSSCTCSAMLRTSMVHPVINGTSCPPAIHIFCQAEDINGTSCHHNRHAAAGTILALR